jgi:hypothetical protein
MTWAVTVWRGVVSARVVSSYSSTPQSHLSTPVYWRRMDTSFDFRTDAGGKDPDVYSPPTLRQYHKLLWSKALPNGRLFDLDDNVPGAYLHHRSDLGEFFLSSDSVIPTFTRWGFAAAHPELVTEAENKAFMAISYTIGGMMVFPGEFD